MVCFDMVIIILVLFHFTMWYFVSVELVKNMENEAKISAENTEVTISAIKKQDC